MTADVTDGAAVTAAAPDPDEAQSAIEYCYDQGWSDGLPLVPASAPGGGVPRHHRQGPR